MNARRFAIATTLFSSLIASLPVLAAEPQLIKSCVTQVTHLETGNPVRLEFKIYQAGSETFGTVTQGLKTLRQQVEIFEAPVRAGLEKISIDDPAIDTLNPVESLISHAMSLTSDPTFEGMFSVSFDLKKVRSAKAYRVGEASRMGSSTVIEARDADGKVLGSFLGGFLVSSCE